MKSFLLVIFFGALLAFAGAFCELWTLPYFTNLPTYRAVGKNKGPAMKSQGFEPLKSAYEAPFANAPNAESTRRDDEMRKAQEQLGGE